VVNPGGTGNIPNALVLGAQILERISSALKRGMSKSEGAKDGASNQAV